ncbi:TPA: hypothetical protein IXF49_001945 [Enterococcus faecium]|nr:hypothetical protein [Enterococcus faecium]HAQ1451956.1 hypothetical protein [Enterococcus faecium]HAQ1486237.1 hypothetical protein [Enterococcus faecium]HAR0785648.1 hypothetical protein [Enterococcus faecium]HAV0209350.1 hypothetical protein [Enterococcus faecium]
MNEPIVYTEIYSNNVVCMKLFRDEDKLSKFLYLEFEYDDAKKLLENKTISFDDNWTFSINYPEY